MVLGGGGVGLLQLSFCSSRRERERKGAHAIWNKGGGCASACGNVPPPLRQLGSSAERQREREGSEGTQVIEVSPPLLLFFFLFFFQGFSPHRPPPRPIHTQRAQLRSPSPHQLAPVIPHFLLNATPLALSLLTSQHPLRGNGGEAARKKKKLGEEGKERTQTVLLLSAPK